MSANISWHQQFNSWHQQIILDIKNWILDIKNSILDIKNSNSWCQEFEFLTSRNPFADIKNSNYGDRPLLMSRMHLLTSRIRFLDVKNSNSWHQELGCAFVDVKNSNSWCQEFEFLTSRIEAHCLQTKCAFADVKNSRHVLRWVFSFIIILSCIVRTSCQLLNWLVHFRFLHPAQAVMCGVSLKNRIASVDLNGRLSMKGPKIVRCGLQRWFGNLERKARDEWVSTFGSFDVAGVQGQWAGAGFMGWMCQTTGQDIRSLNLKAEWTQDRTKWTSLFAGNRPT